VFAEFSNAGAVRKGEAEPGGGTTPAPPLAGDFQPKGHLVVTKVPVIGYIGNISGYPLCSYFDSALDALASVASDDDFAAASSTTIVIFIPPWPNPQ
jgi:hypothetical protein